MKTREAWGVIHASREGELRQRITAASVEQTWELRNKSKRQESYREERYVYPADKYANRITNNTVRTYISQLRRA